MKTNYVTLILVLSILLLASCTSTVKNANTENNADDTNVMIDNQPSDTEEVNDGVAEDDSENAEIKIADLSPNNGHTGTIAKIKLRFCYECTDNLEGSNKDVDFDFEAETIDIKTNPRDGERPGGKTISFDSEEAEDIINVLTKKHGVKLDDYERSECKETDPKPGDLTIVYKSTRRILVEEDFCVTADPALNKFYTDFFDKVYRKYYPKEQDLGIAFADSSWSGPTIDRSADAYVDNPYAGRNWIKSKHCGMFKICFIPNFIS